jgi:hypothetical protein
MTEIRIPGKTYNALTRIATNPFIQRGWMFSQSKGGVFLAEGYIITGIQKPNTKYAKEIPERREAVDSLREELSDLITTPILIANTNKHNYKQLAQTYKPILFNESDNAILFSHRGGQAWNTKNSSDKLSIKQAKIHVRDHHVIRKINRYEQNIQPYDILIKQTRLAYISQ